MSEPTIRERIVEIVSDHLGVEAAEVTDDASLIDDLGADSLDLVELSMAVEAGVGVTLPDDEMDEVQTVGQLIELTERKAA